MKKTAYRPILHAVLAVVLNVFVSSSLTADNKTGVQLEYTKDSCSPSGRLDFYIFNNTSSSVVRLVKKPDSGYRDTTPIKPYSSTGVQNYGVSWEGDMVWQIGDDSNDQFTIWCHTNKFCGNGGNGDYHTSFQALYSNNRGWVKSGILPNTSDVPALDSNRRQQIGNERYIVSLEGFPQKPNGANACAVLVISDATKYYSYGTDFREAVMTPRDLYVSSPEIVYGMSAKIWSSAGFHNHNYPLEYMLKFHVRMTDGHIDFRSSRVWYGNAEFVFNVADYFKEGESIEETRVMVRSKNSQGVTDTWGPGTVKFRVVSFFDIEGMRVDYDPAPGEVDINQEITVAADGARARDNSRLNYIFIVRNNRGDAVTTVKSQDDPVYKFRPRDLRHIGGKGSPFRIAVQVQSQKNTSLKSAERDSGKVWRISND